MWYNIDINKFALQLLPITFRRKKLWAIAVIMLLPLNYVYGLFKAFREQALAKLSINGQVIYIEKVLNDSFSLTNTEIYITDIEEKHTLLNRRSEGPALVYLHKRAENFDNVYMRKQNEGNSSKGNYIVNVPDFLADHESEIRQLINYYNPAGRTYVLNIYKYG